MLKITTTLMIGPASMYAMQHDSGSPLRSSRRITTTMPHSHIGKTRPSRPPIITAGTTVFGRNLRDGLLRQELFEDAGDDRPEDDERHRLPQDGAEVG